MKNKLKMFFCLTLLSAVGACGESETSADIEEYGQTLGESMSGVDEMGGSSGSLASAATVDPRSHQIAAIFKRYAPEEMRNSFLQDLIPEAQAASCSYTFSCASNTRSRSFDSCQMGRLTFNGSISVAFSGTGASSCLLSGDGASAARSPNYTATGLRGATLQVQKTGSVGQKIARVSQGNFTFSNDGIRRTFTAANGSVLVDFSTETTADISVVGSSRSNRTLNGGTLRVTNHLTDVTCDMTPSNLKWASSACTCPNSGSWSGSCSDGKVFTLEMGSSCGEASLTLGDETQDISLDSCIGI